MNAMESHLVNICLFLPLLFAVIVALFPATEKSQIRAITLVGMVLTGLFTLWLYLGFDPAGPEFQHQYRATWIPSLGITYHVGVDGLAVTLILLSGFLGPWVVLASMSTVQDRVKEFHLALLLLQTAMIGALAALDMILFYICWEAMLIPMYLLVGVWGSENRVYAAVKFFIYTLVASLLMLVAFLALYFIATPEGPRTFNFAEIYNALVAANAELVRCTAGAEGACGDLSSTAQALRSYGPWLFAAFALAFAVKVPLVPVHTWLPDAHVQAPMAGSMILAGVMLKMGTFGFWRYALPLFPQAAWDYRVFLALLSVIGIVYGALMCLAQTDIKKLIAYSSVSHLGFCMLGMLAFTTEGATGSAYQMVNHGISTGALFLLFGLIYERRHSRLLADYGGVAKIMPVFTAFFLIITFSSIAVPGTNGFVGEFLVLLGTFKGGLSFWFGIVAATAVILSAAYMLWMVQRVFFGPVTHHESSHLSDLNLRELVTSLPFVILVVLMGLWPQPFLDRLQPSANRFLARVNLGRGAQADAFDGVRMDVLELPPTAGAAAAANGAGPSRQEMQFHFDSRAAVRARPMALQD